MVRCTPTKKARILVYDDLHHSPKDIAENIGCHPSTVRRLLPELRKYRDPYRKKKAAGGKPFFDARNTRRAVRGILSGEFPDATALQRSLFPEVSPSTVRRVLCREGLNGRVRRKKPYLKPEHKAMRRWWAEEFLDLEVEPDWKAVVFSDESKFNLFGSDGRQYCRRRVGEEFLDRNVKKVVKHGGGSLMMWRFLTWEGMGHLHRVKRKINTAQYCKILKESFLGTLSHKNLTVNEVIF